ncbi:Eukaryotic translation initiation factor 3 subunit M, partial [Bienertia sinuspersici]
NKDGGTQDNWTDHDENALIEKDGETCVLGMITQPLVYINYNCKPYALGKHKFELLIGHVAGKRKTKKAYKTSTPRGLTRNLNMAKMRPGEKLKVDFNMNGQPIGDHRATLANYCGALVKDPLNAPLYDVEQFSQIPQENKDKMWQLVLNEMKRLLEQRKAGEISLTDEEIYAKIKPKGKQNSRDRHTGVSPSITSLFGGFSECEKLRKEADKAMNEAAEAKKEAISANEQNKILTKKLKDVERENKDFEESNEKYNNEEDKDEEEISGNDRRHE